MSDDKSQRQKRRAAREGARKLRNKPGWNPETFRTESPEERLMELDQQSRDAAVYSGTSVCEACLQAREESGDETALCEDHLAEAMGF